MDFLLPYYLWIKAFHVISVIFWMAGMYYLPRLYVYHSETETGSALSENYKRMEVLLLRRIINPAMGATWLFGLLMIAVNPALLSEGWLHVKLTLVILMSAYHGVLSKWRRLYEADERPHSSKFLRIANEVPPLLTIFIVIMVIVRPF
ncbi:protoporphyrinogen oxidase HemJ [Tepidicaulis sp. LMO-SS28]|uniref:protoporphyrinogen oxidase HemJ n=1 Tax=Tepidicaulis sp. LMO-SS28 TaxID=3447455 RepID=UPI003EE01CF0